MSNSPMNPEVVGDVLSEQAELLPLGVESMELIKPEWDAETYPFYIVTRPPIPGKTAWSVVPW